jgi:hypothetical protein
MKQWKEDITSQTRLSFLSLSFVQVSRFFHTTSLSLCAFNLVPSLKEKLVLSLSLSLCFRSLSGFVFQSQPKSSRFNFNSLKPRMYLSKSYPITGLDRPLGLQEVEAPRILENWYMDVARLSTLTTGCLYPQEISLYSLLSEVESTPEPLVRPEGLSHWPHWESNPRSSSF